MVKPKRLPEVTNFISTLSSAQLKALDDALVAVVYDALGKLAKAPLGEVKALQGCIEGFRRFRAAMQPERDFNQQTNDQEG